MIVEDAAQAMGGMADGSLLGTLGDAGFFSLSRGKAVSIVEGGIIMTNNPRLASLLMSRVAALNSYGILGQLKLLISACILWLFLRPGLFWFPRLLPFVSFGETIFDPDFTMLRMSGIQAGMARVWRKKLKTFSDARKRTARAWTALLANSPGIKSINQTAMDAASLIRYPVFIDDRKARDNILFLSNKHGWGITRMYPLPVDSIESLRFTDDEKTNPGAHACAEKLITLPNHGFVNKKDLSRTEKILHT